MLHTKDASTQDESLLISVCWLLLKVKVKTLVVFGPVRAWSRSHDSLTCRLLTLLLTFCPIQQLRNDESPYAARNTATLTPARSSRIFVKLFAILGACLTVSLEIRNRTFHIAINYALLTLEEAYIHDRYPNHLTQIRKGIALTERIWARPSGNFLALTQTCRQLRNEFMPIYLAQIMVTVSLKELPAYAATFLGGLKIANIKVDTRDTGSTDIRDVILACNRTSNIQIDFGMNAFGRPYALLCSIQSYPAFAKYVETHTVKVDAATQKQGISVRSGFRIEEKEFYMIKSLDLYVKREFAEMWMSTPGLPRHRGKLKSWRRDLGVGGVQVFPFLWDGGVPLKPEHFV